MSLFYHISWHRSERLLKTAKTSLFALIFRHLLKNSENKPICPDFRAPLEKQRKQAYLPRFSGTSWKTAKTSLCALIFGRWSCKTPETAKNEPILPYFVAPVGTPLEKQRKQAYLPWISGDGHVKRQKTAQTEPILPYFVAPVGTHDEKQRKQAYLPWISGDGHVKRMKTAQNEPIFFN